MFYSPTSTQQAPRSMKLLAIVNMIALLTPPFLAFPSTAFAVNMAIRQELNITDAYMYAASGSYATSSAIVNLDSTQYSGATYYFEVVASTTAATTATVYLVNATSSASVASVSITGGNTYTIYRSSSFTAPDVATDYRVKLGNEAVGKGILASRIVVLQNADITTTETQIEIGNHETYTTTATSTFASPKYWYYDSTKWDGSPTFYGEVTYEVLGGVASSTTYATAGTYTVILPAGTASTSVGLWGGGGAGGGTPALKPYGAAGGAGGQFASSTLVATTTSHTLVVAATRAGTSGAGGSAGNASTWDTGLVVASGGNGGLVATGGNVASTTGNTTGCVGQICFAGGNGGAGSSSYGGGGGGGAGTGGAGGNSTGAAVAGSGTATGGGAGGAKITASGTGSTGTQAGGGGGGAFTSTNTARTGGTGAAGKALITNYIATTTIAIQEDNGSFGAWTDKAYMVRTSSLGAGQPTRMRSTSFTPTTGRNYRVAFKSADGRQTFAIYNAKIIVDQTNPLYLEPQYLISNTRLATGTGLQNYLTTWNPDEWTAGNSYTFVHQMDGAASSASAAGIYTVANALVVGSTVTSPNNSARSSSMTMPGATTDLDVKATTNNNDVYANRILVSVSPSASFVLSGSLFGMNESTPITSGKTIKVAIGTSTPGVFSTTSDGSGNWSLSATGFFSTTPGQRFLAWVSGDTGFRAATFTKASTTGTSIPEIDLYQNRLAVKMEGNSGTSTTNADLDFYDADQDAEIQYKVTSGALNVNKSQELHIAPGTEFAPGGAVTLHGNASTTNPDGDLHLAYGNRQDGVATSSILSMGSSDLNVAGNWFASSSAIFNASNITYFTSTSSQQKNIIATTTPFYYLQFNGSGGSWTFGANAATTSINVDILSGVVTAPSTTFSIGGAFSPNFSTNYLPNGGTTTFNGTSAQTIYLTIDGKLNFANVEFRGAGTKTFQPGSGAPNASTTNFYIVSGSGTVGTPQRLLTISGNFTNNGTFATGTSTVIFDSASAQSLSGTMTGTSSFASTTFIGAGTKTFVNNASSTANFTINSGATVVAPTLLTIGGNYSNSGSFTAGSGTVYFGTTTAQGISGTLNTAATAFNNVVFTGSGTRSFSSNASTTGSFTIDSGVQVILGLPFTIGGNFTNNGTFTPNNGNLFFDSASAQVLSGTMNSATGQFYKMWFFGSGTKTFSNNASTTDLTIAASSGAVIFPTGMFTVSGNFTNNSTFSAGRSTFFFDSASSQSLSGTMTGTSAFASTTFYGAGTKTFSNNASTTNLFTITSGATVVAPTLLTIGGNYSNSGSFTPGSGTVYFSSTTAQTIAGTMNTAATDFNSLWFVGAATKTFSSNASTTGNVTIDSGATVVAPTQLTVGGNYANNGTFTPGKGDIFFDSASSQSLSGTMTGTSAFASTTFYGAGTKTFSNNASTTNLFTITSGATVVAPTLLTIGGNYSNSGSFTPGSGTVYFSSTTAQTIAGTMNTAATDFNSLWFVGAATKTFSSNASTTGNVTIDSGATVVAPTLFEIGGDYANNGTFTHNSGTTTFAGTGAQALSGSMTSTNAFNNVIFRGAGTKSFGANAASTTNVTIESGSGAVTAPSTLLTIAGNYSNSSTFTHNSGTVYFDSNSSQTLSGTMTGTSAFANAIFTGTGTKTFSNNASTTGSVTIIGGGNAGASLGPITSVGTLGTAGDSTGATASLAITTTAAADAGNLVVVVVAKDNVQTTDGQTSEVTSITDSAGGNTWTKAGEYTNGNGGAASGATVSVWYSVVTNTIASSGTITANFSSSITAKAMTAWEYALSPGNSVALAGTLQTEVQDNVDPGALSLSSLSNGEYLFVRGLGYEFGGRIFTPTGSFTAFTGAESSSNTNTTQMASFGEFQILTGTGATSDPAMSQARNNASVFFALQATTNNASDSSVVAPPLLTVGGNYTNNGVFTDNTGTVYFSSGSSQTIAGNLDVSVTDFYGLQFLGAGTKTFSANASTTNFAIQAGSGAVTLPSLLSIRGNYANGSTLTAGAGTVLVDGTSQQTFSGTMTSTSAFNNLKISNTSGTGSTQSVVFAASASTTDTMTMVASTSAQFLAGGTYTFTNISWMGSGSASRAWLRSSSSGTPWNLIVSGTQTAAFLNVKDSNACSGNTIVPTNTFDAGGNTCWGIPLTITFSGTLFDMNETTAVTSGKTIKLAVGTSTTGVFTTTTDGSGNWSVDTDLNESPGQRFLAWVSGDSGFSAATFTKASSTVNNVSRFDLYRNRVTIKHEGFTGTSTTNADLAFYDGASDASVPYRVLAGALAVNKNQELHIAPGTEFAPGGAVTLHGNASTTNPDGDLHLAYGARQDGTATSSILTMAENALTLAGNWFASSSAIFTHVATTTLNSTSTQTKNIIATSTTFNNVAFTSAGKWNFGAYSATTSNLSVATGGTVTFPSGILSIFGQFSNSGTTTATSGTTTFAGTTTQNIAGTQTGVSAFSNVEFSGAGTKRFINNASTTNLNIVSTSGTVTAPAFLSVSGNYANAATFTNNGGKLIASSSSERSFSGNMIGTNAFYSLLIGGLGTTTFLSNASTTHFTTQAASSTKLTSGTSYTVPAGMTSIRVWAVGGGGGGAGVSAGAGGGGAGGGVAMGSFAVTPGDVITYSIGAAGSSGSAAQNGGTGGNTTVTVNGVTVTASGGAGGSYNTAVAASGGTFSAPEAGKAGGLGGLRGTTGGGGGAVGGVAGGTGVGNTSGGGGGARADVSGLLDALTQAGQTLGTPGNGGGDSVDCITFPDGDQGGAATGFGNGGGGGGGCGGNGGNGILGGGGGGASAYSSHSGGAGGAGMVVIAFVGPVVAPSQLTVEGNFTNGGVFSSNSGTLYMSSTTAQTLSGPMNGRSALGNLIFLGSAGKTISGVASTTGAFTINATSGTVSINAPYLDVAGNFTNNGSFSAASTTIFSGASAQTLAGTMTGTSAFGTTTFLGAGTKVFSSNASTSALTVAATSGAVTAPSLLTVSGNFTNAASFTAPTTLYLSGSFANTGTFSHNSGTLIASSSAATTFSGTMTGSSAFNTLTINGSRAVIMSGNASTTNLTIGSGTTFVIAQTVYTSAGSYSFEVPTGVTSIRVKAWGAGGGGGGGDTQNGATELAGNGGGGGYAQATIAVTPAETLTVSVGTGGAGGITANNGSYAGNGGGFSAVQRSSTYLLQAGGGGGGGGADTGGSANGGDGGAGGGSSGLAGSDSSDAATTGGLGGSSTAGGTGGNGGQVNGTTGAANSGGNGGAVGTGGAGGVGGGGSGSSGSNVGGGGGGGGGRYGGGGGGSGNRKTGAGGGGGSDLVTGSDTLEIAGSGTTPGISIGLNGVGGARGTNGVGGVYADGTSGGDGLVIVSYSMGVLLSIAGNYTNNGTALLSGGTTYFTGATPQTLSGTMTAGSAFGTTTFLGAGTKAFSNNASTTDLYIDSTSGAVTAPSLLSIAGNYTNNSTFSAGSGTVYFTGSSAQSLSGTMTGTSALNTATFSGLGTKTFANNASTTGSFSIMGDNVGDAITSLGTIGTSTSLVSTNTLVLTTTATAEAGHLVVLLIAKDNVQTTDGETSEVTSITDSASGNTWTKAGEFTNGNAGAGAGATVSAWYSVLTNTISSGAAITANFSSSITAKAMSGWEYNLGTGNVISVAGTLQTLANDTADPGAMSLSGLSSGEYLFVRGMAVEAKTSVSFSVTANFTAFGTSYADSGGDATSMAALSEFIIQSGTGATSDPALSNTRDIASVFFALKATKGSTVVAPSLLSIAGNYTNNGFFTHNSGTVYLNGSAQQTLSGTLRGDSPFYNLTILNTSGTGGGTQSVIFGASASTTNMFTMVASTSAQFLAAATSTFTNISWNGGSSATRVWLRSSSAGTPWGLITTGTQSVNYVDVKDSYACAGSSIITPSSYDSSGNSCWTFTAVPTIASAANQTFTIGDGTTPMSQLTITEMATPSITAANDLRIAISTSTTFMLWDTSDTTATFGGTASAKVSSPVSYEGGGSVLLIPVGTSFAGNDTLTISGLNFMNFTAPSPVAAGLKVFLGGASDQTADATDSKTIGIKGAFTPGEHAASQISNTISDASGTVTDLRLYAFNLTLNGENIAITSLPITLTGMQGIAASDITNAALFIDYDGDKTIDADDTQVGGAGVVSSADGQSGTITFSSSFTATTTRSYVLRADVAGIATGDSITLSLTPSSIVSSGVTSLISTTPASTVALSGVQHVKVPSGGGATGGSSPAGQGVQSNGGQGGGGSGQEIGNDPNFFAPTTSGGTFDAWTTPANAFTSDNAYATAASTWLREDYGGFGFSIPGSNTINGIEVRLELSGSTAAGTISVALSWDGGTSTTTPIQTTGTLSATDAVVTLGGPADTWGRTWAPANFSDANFKVRVIAQPSGNTVKIDAIQVNVHDIAGGGGSGGGDMVSAGSRSQNLASAYQAAQEAMVAGNSILARFLSKLSYVLAPF